MNALSLPVTILAVNEAGHDTPSGYEDTGEAGVLPVLQDVAEVDVWGTWEVVYRDVYVVNECGEKTAVYNLSSQDLNVEENYNQLKALVLEAVGTEG